MRKVTHPNRAPPDLVLIGGADATSRCTDLEFAGILAQPVEVAVERQDQRAIVSDLQIFRGDRHPLPRQLCDLVTEMPRVEHDAIADDRHGAAHDSGREQA